MSRHCAVLDGHLTTERRGNSQSEEAIEARCLDQQIESLDAKFASASAAPPPTSLVDTATEILAQDNADYLPAFTTLRGASHELRLNFPDAPHDAPCRWMAALMLVLAGGASTVLLRRAALPTFAPWFVIGAAGLVWWLWLVPSILGFVVLVAAGAAGLFARWRSRPRSITNF